MFRFTGYRTGVTANTAAVIDDKSKVGQCASSSVFFKNETLIENEF